MYEQLKSHLFARIARAGDDQVNASHFCFAELVALEPQDLARFRWFNQFEQDGRGSWGLAGQRPHADPPPSWGSFRLRRIALRPGVRTQGRSRSTKTLPSRTALSQAQSFGFVGCIDHHEIYFRCTAVNQQIVNHIGMWV